MPSKRIGAASCSASATLFFTLLLTIRIYAQDSTAPWTYAGASGPEHWRELNPAYSTCATGTEQSPINIRDPKVQTLPVIHFDYKDTPLDIIDNGHSVQVNYAPGSAITLDGRRFELKQLHFHHPGENQIDGKSYVMEAHLVHSDSEGRLVVLAVLLKQGAANPVVRDIWSHIPKSKQQEQVSHDLSMNAAALLPAKTSYLTYSGSLTTPPCTEGVTWLVLTTPVTISKRQIEEFGRLYPHNVRPVQPLGKRVVAASQ